jgi:hypothetical protein
MHRHTPSQSVNSFASDWIALAIRSISTVVLVTIFSCCGCHSRRAKPVDQTLALKSLKQTLETWKQGESLTVLKSASPPVIVQEPDWSNGVPLAEFELVGKAKREDANLYQEVELMLGDKHEGTQKRKRVTYVVGTDPVITVFRAIL